MSLNICMGIVLGNKSISSKLNSKIIVKYISILWVLLKQYVFFTDPSKFEIGKTPARIDQPQPKPNLILKFFPSFNEIKKSITGESL